MAPGDRLRGNYSLIISPPPAASRSVRRRHEEIIGENAQNGRGNRPLLPELH
jgi:hypothetical protein